MILWRISNHDSLNGAGALRSDGRWHTQGRPVVYCTQSPAAALLEMLVRLELTLLDAPVRYRLLRIDAPDDMPVEALAVARLQPEWVTDRRTTQEIGDDWLASTRSALLFVPSAVAPATSNVLLNPAHPQAGRVSVASVSEHELDSRLLG